MAQVSRQQIALLAKSRLRSFCNIVTMLTGEKLSNEEFGVLVLAVSILVAPTNMIDKFAYLSEQFDWYEDEFIEKGTAPSCKEAVATVIEKVDLLIMIHRRRKL